MTLRTDHYEADVIRSASGSVLRVTSPADAQRLRAFEGTVSTRGTPRAAGAAVGRQRCGSRREAFEVLRPQSIGETATSIGTGDRLGLATAGQARAFREQGAGTMPVLAQQSIREMDRLGREALSVIDDAVFGCVEEGWDGGFGADCDHIKTTEGIDRGLAAGFVTFTLDPGDKVVDVTAGVTPAQLDEVPWDLLGDDLDWSGTATSAPPWTWAGDRSRSPRPTSTPRSPSTGARSPRPCACTATLVNHAST